jgi:hypothetical protein
MAQNPCDDNKPFILLGNGATAPVLNYNLPQETCIEIDVEIPLFIPGGHFSEKALEVPENNIWDRIKGMSYESLLALLKEDIVNGVFSLFFNGRALLKVKDAIRFVNSPVYSEAVVSFDKLNSNKIKAADVGSIIRTNSNIASTLNMESNITAGYTGNRVSNMDILNGGLVSFGESEAKLSRKAKVRVNHLSGIPMAPENQIQVAGLTLDYIVKQMMKGLVPEVYQDVNGRVQVGFREKPSEVKPELILIEEHKLCAYLADYGAGKVVKTFSLLPGEKTQITIKSFKDYKSSYRKSSLQSETDTTSTYYADDEKSTSSKSDTVLDSFSQSSIDSLQKQIENRTQTDTSNSSSSNSSKATEKKVGARLQYRSNKVDADASGSIATTNVDGTTSNQMRSESVSTLNNAMESHVQESAKNREVEVNTTTGSERNAKKGGEGSNTSTNSLETSEEISRTEQDEITTIRNVENINYSRVLNFIFRQMLQQYITLTYLDNLRLVFSNGYRESIVQFKISDLDGFLTNYIIPAKRAEVKKAILIHFCNVTDYLGVKQSFLEKIEEDYNDCDSELPDESYTYYRKKFGITQTYSTGSFSFSVPGIILAVNDHMLKTDSVICDALLGQGEALDCYNNRLQNETANQAVLGNERFTMETERNNQRMLAEIDTINTGISIVSSIVDPLEQVAAYRKIFGECCIDELKDLIKELNCSSETPS